MKQEKRIMELRAVESVDKPNEMIVEGYAITFNTATVIAEYEGRKYYEIIHPDALREADMSDVVLRYNHSDNVMLLARTTNKTLRLNVDGKGLFVSGTLANTTAGRDLYELIKNRFVDKMSFAFTTEEESYNTDTLTRTITKIKKLYDVAAVDNAAYGTTNILARGFYDEQNAKELKALHDAEARNKLLVQTYL